GGRKGEVAYLIDGIPVTDSFDRSAMVDVNKNMVQELQVISGAFNAEYGKVMSGIVNITTSRGSETFGGNLEFYTGDYVSTHDDVFMNINSFNPKNIYNTEANFYGPIIKEKLYYNFNYRHIYFGGWNQGQQRYKPEAVIFPIELSTGETYWALIDSTKFGDNEYVAMNWNRKNYFQGQLIYKFTNTINLTYNVFYDAKNYQDYDMQYQYNPDGLLSKNLTGITHILKLQNQLSTRTFYNLGFSNSSRKYKGGYSDKTATTDSTIYVHPYYLNQYAYQFHVGGTQNSQESRNSQTALIKFDLTSQISKQHQLKFGADFYQHNIEWESYELRPAMGENFYDHDSGEDFPTSFNPYIHPTRLPDSTIYSSSYIHRPYEYSAFVQDKMEFTEIIVNLGVRLDYFEPDGVILADPSDPEIYNPIKPENRFHDLDENGMQDVGEASISSAERLSYWYKDATAKLKISPRIGISFPVSDRGVFHFSYGHFFQIPNFDYLYQNPEFELGSGTGNQGVVGNADLKPEQTIVGELGLQQQLSDNLSMDVTVYMKDVRDLTGTRAEEIEIFGGAATYSRLVNSDFGVIKGITLALNQHQRNGFFTSMDYTFQIAEGTASDPNAYRDAISGGNKPEIQLNPLAWDQRHTINLIAGLNKKYYGMTFIGRYGSGLPYTPKSSEDITSLLTNSEIKPANFNVDGRGFYKITEKIEMFFRVKNLFDTMNEVNVYSETGRAGFTTEEEQIEALNVPTPINSIHEYFINPTHYSEPRRFEIGMKIKI
ncbi:TonB-dependent receptor, partial [bacterium]|nr:TonB-dependent receptor [bacterium]